ncbi:MAG: HD domain-containing phosphohydrolase [Vulcanimicrobiota bacterium]
MLEIDTDSGVAEVVLDEKQKLDELINIGIALNNERRLDKLLTKIVTEARRFTRADAGTLYLVEGDNLRFEVSQNDTLQKIYDQTPEDDRLPNFLMPISMNNIAGYVATTGDTVNLKDVYRLPPNVPYKFNKRFDRESGYRAKSMLVVPMTNANGETIGVIQLINSLDLKGKVVSFKKEYEKLTLSLASQAAVAVEMAKMREELKSTSLEMMQRLSVAAEFRDEDTAWHVKRMSLYSRVIAEGLGFSNEEAEEILFTSPMHDIGKIGVPDAILLKPGKLTDEERETMKKHTVFGSKILAGSKHKIIKKSQVVALTHHEKWDGTGYPEGKKGEEIPIEGRIVAVADVFDALTQKRCYKPAFPLQKVEKILFNDTGTHFDPGVTKAFFENYDRILDVFEEYKEN